ncbi:P63C domain-containing protein [Myxococcus sp. MxC21-1]|uniref:P63C domain-containing protein n=1 Tax=Myxococcus sp. MxC21-1 TaxID=3041439 RepID=UPI00292D48C1|nr:P63C domain-containing protein [Myxococcus sp. MxC21-1]WNZ59865.1 P63C domain-containing protein [Myxococcus sp. MxC21-1]
MRIGNVELACHVLSDGTRVVAQKEMLSALALSRGGAGAGKGDRLATFVAGTKIKPFVSEDLAKGIHSAIRFRIAGVAGRPSFAYEATVLADLCTAIVNAHMEGRLQKQQEHIARSAARLLGAFAKLGIIATIDEATGYQTERSPTALREKLAEFLMEAPATWSQRFPDGYYQRLYRLTRLPRKGGNHPRLFAALTREFVWKRLDIPGIVDALERLNPANENGDRAHLHHLFLTEGPGVSALGAHLVKLQTLMDLAKSIEELRWLAAMAMPGRGENLALPFVDALLNGQRGNAP